jgi:hypothetical protein
MLCLGQLLKTICNLSSVSSAVARAPGGMGERILQPQGD